jgi:prevent-host-death family protein
MDAPREVGAFEAKNTLSALLNQVEAGEEVIITRRGKPVARLVGARSAACVENHAQEAAQRIRRRASETGFAAVGWTEWRPMRDEGRR